MHSFPFGSPRTLLDHARTPALLLVLASGCSASHADLTGTALGIDFSDIKAVFYGGPYLVMTPSVDVDCEGVAFVRQTYEQGVPPTDDEVELIQFTYVAGDLAKGNKSIAENDAEVTSIVLATDGAQLEFERATGGTINVDSLDTEKSASGTIDSVTFVDGAISGDFTAEWCRNLRDR